MGLGRDLFAQHQDGRQIPVEISLTPVETDQGALVVATIIDLTERVAATEKVAEKNRELEALNVELSHFAYSASHDLKAPLSSITGLVALCIEDLDDGDTEEIRLNMSKILQISRRSASKVEKILKIARSGRAAVAVEPIDLAGIVQEVWMDLTGGQGATRLRVDIMDKQPVELEPTTMKVILENLISNSLRYGDANKNEHVIEVVSSRQGGELQISVQDNGVGIPEQSQDRVFQMFTRLDKRSGDGLGLTLVKKQIDRLGGKIEFTSQVGRGCRFTVTLPLGNQG